MKAAHRTFLPLLVAVLTLANVPPTAAASTAEVEVRDSTGRFKVEPKTLDLNGMPGPWYYRKLEWRSWGPIRAESKMARLKVQDCKPSCAEGGFKTISARLTLAKPGRCRGHRVYTKAVLDPKKGGFAPVGTDIEPEPTLALEITCDGYVQPW